jgi:superoxide dismutase
VCGPSPSADCMAPARHGCIRLPMCAGATQFGSGWAWLSVGKEGKLEVTKTPNAENPWVHGSTPILTLDVW